MAKAELKTKKTNASVKEFLDAIPDEANRKDCRVVAKMMKEITGAQPRMWGTSIVGFGTYHYKGASGREGDWPVTGFSPRKQALTLYIMAGFGGRNGLMEKLGKYKTGKACLYIKRLSDVDLDVLGKLIQLSVKSMEGKGR